jgi:hypothetical protein
MEALGTPPRAPAHRSGWVTLVGVLFMIGGGFDLIWSIVALGVSLGGTDRTVLGDLSVHNLEGLGIVGLIISGIQLYVGYAIMSRLPSGQILGIVIASLVVLMHFAYIRVLDAWGFVGLIWNLVIILILVLRSEEFTVTSTRA